ncbi:hypothetical protein H5125_13220 [Shewanella sp. SR44-4]|nr:hypothetical protein [Shewanella sp. SR44-4]MBB1363106.1 hypothetical protein [Shewanella sp. SR44-4]|tara:strand:- start:3054 stop:3401 length:348 start_codon:yes stop_codon:yes gene_type:complete
MKLNDIVNRIVLINRAWKVAKEDPSPQLNTLLANRLKNQKSAWQIELFRSFPEQVWFKKDLDNYPDGSVFSVRWMDNPIISSDGDIKWNAEHLPVDIAKNLLTHKEFHIATKLKT